jgi:hypothetical protein
MSVTTALETRIGKRALAKTHREIDNRRCDSSCAARSAFAIERVIAMQRKNYFPPEADTQPDVLRAKLVARRSVKAPKCAASNPRHPGVAGPGVEGPGVEGPGLDGRRPEGPPKGTEALARASANRRQPRTDPPRRSDKVSGVRPRRPISDRPAACVDEVVADLSHDPRREPD